MDEGRGRSMIEYWERSEVKGQKDGVTVVEFVLHRRGEDPMVMACRRSHALAGCDTFSVRTDESFIQVKEEDEQKSKEDIPGDERRAEDWEF